MTTSQVTPALQFNKGKGFLTLCFLAVDGRGPSDTWAVALSEDGQFLAGVSQDGHIRVWDLNSHAEQIRDYETKGSFGTCIDLVSSSKPLDSQSTY